MNVPHHARIPVPFFPLVALVAACALGACGATRGGEAAPSDGVPAPRAGDGAARAGAAPALEPFTLVVPGTTAELALLPVPGGAVAVSDPTADSGARHETVGPLWVSSTEITWDMYDAFVFAMDRAEGEQDPPDAWARPSKPYILMDRGFGHAGYPVISVSLRGAGEFCAWLSAKTGRRFRLPTEAEWVHAALGGAPGPYACAADALDGHAWYRANSIEQNRPSTHPVGAKAANGYGLHDVHGNAAEWTTAADGSGVLRGGSFKDAAEKLAVSARLADDPEFNASDPQIPQSVWWLADGPFAGFRVVCEP